MSHLTIALDTMSGDFGPCVSIPAAIKILSAELDLFIFLIGDPNQIEPYLSHISPTLLSRLTVIPAYSVITNDIKPSHAIRHSQGSSMRMALEFVYSGKAQACVSAGNTGALMGLSKLLIKPIDGIERPALVAALPNQQHGYTLLLDLGANVGSDSNMLVQFALMGAVLAKDVFNIANPRINLLNIGEEMTKGLNDIRHASSILSSIPELNYQGYLEANHLLTGKTDVLVCDGFVGNVTLKTVEGMGKMFLSLLTPSTHSSWGVKMLHKLLGQYITKRFGYLDPDHYNGAFLLGLRSIVVKSHGASNVDAFAMAIKQAANAIRKDVPTTIASGLAAILPKDN